MLRMVKVACHQRDYAKKDPDVLKNWNWAYGTRRRACRLATFFDLKSRRGVGEAV